MASGEGPDAWLGLLKWTLSHQDGTEPSDARPMGDEDRAWLEKVVNEGVRDDFKTMTDIYSRLCAYLDRAASNPAPALPSCAHQLAGGQELTAEGEGNTAVSGAGGATTTAGTVGIGPRPPSDFVPPQPPPATTNASASATGAVPATAAGGEGALSTFTVVAPSFSSPSVGQTADAAAAAGGATSGRVGEGGCTAEELKAMEAGVLDDLEELQDIVEQIDMAATFAKIGGFGRLIALVTPSRRPEKLRLRAASLIATLTKNNPPAQAAFSSSRGHKALIEVVAAQVAAAATSPNNTASPETPGDASDASPPSAPSPSLSLQRAILHALSSSVMGLAPAEDALCLEPGFREFLAQALSQAREGTGGATGAAGESSKLRSKAAFVLKALISSPEANRARVEALWPAVLGLVAGLEALAAGDEEDPAAALETCIEALLAASRSPDGDRLVRDLGSRVSRVAARRRQVLVETRLAAAAASGGQEDDAASAEYELGLWSEWDALTGPAQ
ncbi:unnamed protein product [Ectocarpus sp. CCAP 1310/34]|nr:unnamed protein product [Ectocarpus sp. CCAP 1310/34]